MDIFFLIFGNF